MNKIALLQISSITSDGHPARRGSPVRQFSHRVSAKISSYTAAEVTCGGAYGTLRGGAEGQPVDRARSFRFRITFRSNDSNSLSSRCFCGSFFFSSHLRISRRRRVASSSRRRCGSRHVIEKTTCRCRFLPRESCGHKVCQVSFHIGGNVPTDAWTKNVHKDVHFDVACCHSGSRLVRSARPIKAFRRGLETGGRTDCSRL